MPVKTPASPARKPAGRTAVRASKDAKPVKAKPVKTKPVKAKSVKAKPAKAKRAKVKPVKTSAVEEKTTGPEPGSTLSSPAASPRARVFCLVKEGRHVPSKILHDDLAAPVSKLLARVSGAIEDELTQIEMIVSGGAKLRERAQAERRARTLASLARTLREVMQLRAGEEKTKRDDDSIPRDIGELRRELARRLDKIVGDAKAAHPGESG